MEVKKIVEGMTAPQVAQVIDENFNALNGEKATVEAVADVQKNVNRSDDNTGILSYPVFDDTEPVAVGDVRRYEGLLYRAKEAGAHDWDPEKWERVTLKQLEDEKLSELGSEVGSLVAETGRQVSVNIIGDGAIQQQSILFSCKVNGETVFFFDFTITGSDSAIYIRAYDEEGNTVLNSRASSVSGGNYRVTPNTARRVEIIYFATIAERSVVGEVYTANCRCWIDNTLYSKYKEISLSLSSTNENIDEAKKDIVKLNNNLTTLEYNFGNSSLQCGTLIKDSLIGNGTQMQSKLLASGELLQGSRYIYCQGEILSEALNESDPPTIYCRLYDNDGNMVLNKKVGNPINTWVGVIPENAKYFSFYLFATLIENSIIGNTYSAKLRFWTNKSDYYRDGISNAAYGKHFGVAGDSITAGNQWSYYMCEDLGSTQNNVAVGGACWSYRSISNIEGTETIKPQHYTDDNFVGFGFSSETNEDRQKLVNNNACVHVEKYIAEFDKGNYQYPDAFIFAYGTNYDLVGTEEQIDLVMGYTDDINSSDYEANYKPEMCGAMRWCIQTIKKKFPRCQVFISLPIQRADYQYNKNTLYPKIKLMKEMAIQMGCKIIDQYSGSGITSAIENGTSPYLIDGLHPNSTGARFMGAFATKNILSQMMQIPFL